MVLTAAYSDTLDFLYGLNRFGIKPGLERIGYLMDELGNPQEQLDIVHVGGTNGKGSASAAIERVLREAGYRTGIYTSPHLQSFRERIRYIGRVIPREAVVEGVSMLKELAAKRVAGGGDHPTFFEFVTALMYWHFAREGAQLVVQEVGLGGTYDATNVVSSSLVTVLTTVDLDHTRVLGNSVDVIAADKAGILRRGVPLVTGFTQQEAQQAVARCAAEIDAPILYVHEAQRSPWCVPAGRVPVIRATYNNVRVMPVRVRFDYEGTAGNREPGWVHLHPVRDLELPLFGRHQAQNAALAVSAIMLLAEHGYHVDDEQLRRGLAAVQWPGRLERVSESPAVYLDGAHNAAGAEALADSLALVRQENRPLTLVFGVLRDKPWKKMLASLLPHVDSVVFTTAQSPRAEDPAVLLQWLNEQAVGVDSEARDDPTEAVELVLSRTPPTGAVCIAGSLYLVGSVRSRWHPGESD